MDKLKRAERLVAISQILMAKPNTTIPLTFFAERFGAAKSTISEDLLTVKESFEVSGQGRLETLTGAAGGVRYLPGYPQNESYIFLKDLAKKLSVPERILPGGYLYMTDILFDPAFLRPLGLILGNAFREAEPEVVVTIETKGIPLALVTAETLGVPLVIIRRGSKVTEGSSVGINYVSGSTRRIDTMSLPRRALAEGKRVLLIDDFMKAGGTALGMMNLMAEFKAQVVGVGIFVEGGGNQPKLVQRHLSLLQLNGLEAEKGEIFVVPANDGEIIYK